MNRRYFIGAALASAAAGKAVAANDKVNLGMIGVGGRGRGLTRTFLGIEDANVVHLCDADQASLERTQAEVAKAGANKPKETNDMRHLFDDPEVDAVVIATPDHWHAPATILGCDAGKDVYVEKPMGNVLSEVNEAFEAAQRSDRVIQVGTQRRSFPRYRSAADIVSEGRIGEIVKADVVWNMYSPYRWAKSQEDLDSVKESDINWEAFLMGKPHRPFDPKIYRSFRLFRDFSSAIIDQWMSHGIDVVHMLTGELYPASLVAHGGLYRYHDYRENPDTVQVALEYGHGDRKFPASFSVCLSTKGGRATHVLGTLGMLEVEDTWRVSGDGSEHPDALPDEQEVPEKPSDHHMANWLDAIRRRDRDAVYAPVEVGYGHSIAGIMATDSLWSGRRKVFNPGTREITDG